MALELGFPFPSSRYANILGQFLYVVKIVTYTVKRRNLARDATQGFHVSHTTVTDDTLPEDTHASSTKKDIAGCHVEVSAL